MGNVWKDENNLRDIANKSTSMTEMLSFLGLNTNSGNYQTLKKYCLLYSIEIPKYDRKSRASSDSLKNVTPLEVVFSNRGIKVSGQILRYKLVKYKNRKDECEICSQLPIWNGIKLVLEVDHVDGNIFNNNVDNLRILCPNCHSQTATFRGKNSGKRIYNYCACGKRIAKQSKKCTKCNVNYRNETYLATCRYPDINTLYCEYVESGSFEKLASKYSVSSNAIRKYIKKHNISIEDFKNKKLHS